HGDGVATVSGGKLAQDYISVLRTRDGQILLYRDFWNPLRHLEAGLPARWGVGEFEYAFRMEQVAPATGIAVFQEAQAVDENF
ncbi:hypothetical protein IGA85_33285, partial [Pseudomonas aeruginosa]